MSDKTSGTPSTRTYLERYIMNKLELMAHKVDVNARAFAGAVADKLQERREAGQGTIEYLGIAVLIAVLVAALVTFFEDSIADAIGENVTKVINKIFNKEA